MPILVRPVREQLEHDRIIRLLQARYRRKHEVGINVGAEQVSAVPATTPPIFPDLVLLSQERGHRLQGTVEVETGESVNTLEALAEWGPYSRLKVPFHLYVPPSSLDTVRRLCSDHGIAVAELWTYHAVGDDMRFTMVQRSAAASAAEAAADARRKARAGATAKSAAPARSAKSAGARSGKPAAAKPAKAAKAAKPVKVAKASKPAKPKPVQAARSPKASAKPAKGAKTAKARSSRR